MTKIDRESERKTEKRERESARVAALPLHIAALQPYCASFAFPSFSSMPLLPLIRFLCFLWFSSFASLLSSCCFLCFCSFTFFAFFAYLSLLLFLSLDDLLGSPEPARPGGQDTVEYLSWVRSTEGKSQGRDPDATPTLIRDVLVWLFFRSRFLLWRGAKHRTKKGSNEHLVN